MIVTFPYFYSAVNRFCIMERKNIKALSRESDVKVERIYSYRAGKIPVKEGGDYEKLCKFLKEKGYLK